MAAENRTWGAPRIHGELRMLGFDISERQVLRWMRKAHRDTEPARRWAAFLNNHREAVAVMDFVTVPALTFGVLYCFCDRSGSAAHSSLQRYSVSNESMGISTAARGLPYDSAPRFLIFDREHTFEGAVIEATESLGITPVRIAVPSPMAERPPFDF